MEITYWTKEMKTFGILEMKIVIDCKKNQNGETYIIPSWIGSNLPLMTSSIWLWNEGDEYHMLNDTDEEV